jgi:hypothetical protein
MKLNVDKLRESYENNQRGGEFWTPDQGVTMLYIHGLCRQNDTHELTEGINNIPIVIHYGVGPDNEMVVCLDPERNPIINHPFVQECLAQRKEPIQIGNSCPICSAIEEGRVPPDQADRISPTTRYIWGVTPIKYKTDVSSKDWNNLTVRPRIALVGNTIYNGFMQVFFEVGDITDLEAMIFVLVSRTGKGRYDTKYVVSSYNDRTKSGSVAKPMVMPAKMRGLISKAVTKNGDCDLFRTTANLIKGKDRIEEILKGVCVSSGVSVENLEEDIPVADDLKFDDMVEDIDELEEDFNSDEVPDEDFGLDELDFELTKVLQENEEKKEKLRKEAEKNGK